MPFNNSSSALEDLLFITRDRKIGIRNHILKIFFGWRIHCAECGSLLTLRLISKFSVTLLILSVVEKLYGFSVFVQNSVLQIHIILMRIRIQLFTLIRIRIQLPKIMRIREDPDTQPWLRLCRLKSALSQKNYNLSCVSKCVRICCDGPLNFWSGRLPTGCTSTGTRCPWMFSASECPTSLR